jgi:hypothetical protein
MRYRYLAIGLLVTAGCGAAEPSTQVPENVVSSPSSSSEIGKSGGVAYNCNDLPGGECCFGQGTSDGFCTTWPVHCNCRDGSSVDGNFIHCNDGTTLDQGPTCPLYFWCGDGVCNNGEVCNPDARTYCPADCGTC